VMPTSKYRIRNNQMMGQNSLAPIKPFQIDILLYPF